MSATVIDISDRLRARLSSPSDVARARQLVAERLAPRNLQIGRVRAAQDRVERSIRAGFNFDKCVQRAVDWALGNDIAPISKPQPPIRSDWREPPDHDGPLAA